MSYDESDAAADEFYSRLYEEIGPEWARDHAQEIFEESYDEATKRFTEERLKSYYLQHPDAAIPAVHMVDYARQFVPNHETAAVVFAATSTELTWKQAILKPLVSGLVHIDALAETIVNQTIPKTGGLARLNAFLSEILRETAGIDFGSFKRKDSDVLLREEINTVAQTRNDVLHRGLRSDPKMAAFAIQVADSLLLDLYPKLLDSLGLRLDGLHMVHDKYEIFK